MTTSVSQSGDPGFSGQAPLGDDCVGFLQVLFPSFHSHTKDMHVRRIEAWILNMWQCHWLLIYMCSAISQQPAENVPSLMIPASWAGLQRTSGKENFYMDGSTCIFCHTMVNIQGINHIMATRVFTVCHFHGFRANKQANRFDVQLPMRHVFLKVFLSDGWEHKKNYTNVPEPCTNANTMNMG